jgi:LPS sulfotransferase NodH
MKPAKALRHIRYSLQTLDAPARGCKLMLYQLARCGLTLDSLEAAFSEPKYIVLYRQSLAEQYVSLQAAMTTNQWAVFGGEQPKQTLIKIDPEEFRRYSERIQQGYRELLTHRAIAERGILLSYEELTQNPAGWLRHGICPHLGVPAAEPTSVLRKQSSKPLAERVANYSAVAALLNGPLGRQHYVLPGQRAFHRRAA